MKLEMRAELIRKEVVERATEHRLGHIAPSLSTVEILTVLFYSILKTGDVFVLSKGHGCYAYYAILAGQGKIQKDWWALPGCSERMPPHIPAGTGALGHGLPIAAGMAWAQPARQVYCLVGDGELQEGSNWEALQFATHHRLPNLGILVDHNGLQAMDKTKNVLYGKVSGTVKEKLEGFGAAPVFYCEGHDVPRIKRAFKRRKCGRPWAVIFITTKGKGVKCMEGVAKWHFRVPEQEELNAT